MVVNFCRDQSRSSVKHLASAMLLLSPLFPLFSPLKLLGKSVVPILTQKYTGDITIMPPMTFKGMVTILTNPSPDEYLGDLRRGEQVTWPQISRMRLHVAIEFLLEDCRNSCRRQLARLEQELLETGSSAGSPRLTRGTLTTQASHHRGMRMDNAIPTASVLNLHELDMSTAVAGGASVIPPSAQLQSRPRRRSSSAATDQSNGPFYTNTGEGGRIVHGGMSKSASFLSLQDKLKSRVQSFAADLSALGRQAAADSLGEDEHNEHLLGDDAASTGSGI